jgi:hypothetical protein
MDLLPYADRRKSGKGPKQETQMKTIHPNP